MPRSTIAQAADVTFAQFVLLQPFPGTVDFEKWEKAQVNPAQVDNIPITRHWLLPNGEAAEDLHAAPSLRPEEIRGYTQQVWDKFYSFSAIWQRAQCVKSLKGASGVHADLETLPPDVREYRHRDRQRPPRARQSHG